MANQLFNMFGALGLDSTLVAIRDKLLSTISGMPNYGDNGYAVRQLPQHFWDWSFAQTVANGVSGKGQLICTGAGMTVNQTGGNLVITAGTTINAETVIRSVESFSGALTFGELTTLSQRIANNNFYAELVDVIGDNLVYNIVSATVLDVTKNAHGFTAANVGQRMDWCALSSVGVPQEVVIASIPDANTIRFTKVGNPGAGSGTCSLTGWNKIELNYTGTSATAVNLNTRRQGYQNTSVAAAINTTASGHIGSVNISSGVASLSDQVNTSAGGLTNRAAWRTNVPEPEITLFLQLRVKNGTVAPATSTTWTVGMVRVEDYIASTVELTGTRQQSSGNRLPVDATGIVTANISAGTVYPLIAAAAATGIALTQHKLISAATTNATSVKATAGRIASGNITNNSASWRYLKLYNKASAPTVGTDVPIQVIGLKPGDNTDLTNLVNIFGLSFATGIAYAITGAPADNDTTAIGASEVIVAMQFI